MKLLLTDGGHKNTLAIIRYLGKERHTIDILHHKKSAPAYSKNCRKLIICPQINKELEYFEFVFNLVQNQKYDILIPVGIKAIEVLSKHLAELHQFIKIEICKYETIQIALEKKLTFQYAEKNGINCPKTIYPSNIEEAISLSNKLTYPLIIKSSNEGITKFPTIYINDKEQLITALTNLKNTEPEAFQKCFPLLQERVYGKGYGFFAIYQNGICKKIFMHERIRENPVSGGISTCARSYYDPKLLEIGKKILDGLHWHGQAMVEFKKDENDGEYKLIEINPKFWGSLELCLSSGMNFPLYLCEIAMGEELEYSDQYNRKRTFLWLVAPYGELYRLFQKPSDIFSVLYDWIRINSRSDVWISDFKPTLIQFVYFLYFIKDKIKSHFKKQ
jgi:predicted ATP-grasp superfamily ATP-dependent carboligase